MDDRTPESERELGAAVDDLTDALEALQSEFREPPRGPLGLPRPPTPGELLRFTERYTIPALVSLLEANIRLLELLAGAIRLADGRALAETDDGRPNRIATASRTALEKLDTALAEVQAAAAGGEPGDAELERLLSEARDLRAEVDERLAAATEGDIGPADETQENSIGISVRAESIDIDEELRSIKRDVNENEDSDDVDEDE
ncbi:MAG: hypothetical protein ACI8UR_000361 [Natronomonas sp.]|jgi:hypothetical protein|uniref:DUF7547 family protein n=1 Tax=Natronomonas sp. TaxID=2184060 RepID=UPI00398A0501